MLSTGLCPVSSLRADRLMEIVTETDFQGAFVRLARQAARRLRGKCAPAASRVCPPALGGGSALS
jgi:hypothetical protein